jgi:hypothetical protein
MGNPESALRALNDIAIGKHHIPILYALGDIKGAHTSYRSRAISRSIAQRFNMPPPERLFIKSGDYRSKRALILAEGGPGDEIRMAAMYAEFGDWFKEITITCDPRLHSLLKRSFPNVHFVPVPRYRQQFRPGSLSDRASIQDPLLSTFMNDEALELAKSSDFVCSILDTLGEFRAERNDFRRMPSRLIPDERVVQTFADKSDKIRVGIAWRSILLSATRNLHYLDVADLEPLAKIQNAEFWVLQACASKEELELLSNILPSVNIVDVDLRNDFEGQSALISTMDCVISPLTTIAELAGILGVCTYLLSTTHTTTWRKNADSTDVWYENGRLVYGTPVGDRESLMNKVADQIAEGSECMIVGSF